MQGKSKWVSSEILSLAEKSWRWLPITILSTCCGHGFTVNMLSQLEGRFRFSIPAEHSSWVKESSSLCTASGWAIHLPSWSKSVPCSWHKLLSFSKTICISVSIHRVGACQQKNAQAWLLAGHCCIGLCQTCTLPFALLPSMVSLCHLGFLCLLVSKLWGLVMMKRQC